MYSPNLERPQITKHMTYLGNVFHMYHSPDLSQSITMIVNKIAIKTPALHRNKDVEPLTKLKEHSLISLLLSI